VQVGVGEVELRDLGDPRPHRPAGLLTECGGLLPGPFHGGPVLVGHGGHAAVTGPVDQQADAAEAGQVLDLGELADCLNKQLVVAGGSQRTARVQRLIVNGSNAAAMLEGSEVLNADVIVIAAGVASGALLQPLGYRVPIIAERGYHIQCASAEWPAALPPIVFEERSMIVTPFRSGLRAASFVEFGRADSPADSRKWARLRSHVSELGLPFREPCSEWFGARPTLPDYLPAIGRSRRATNLLYAFGHQHLGLTLAAITGELIAALARGAATDVDVTPLDLERFG